MGFSRTSDFQIVVPNLCDHVKDVLTAQKLFCGKRRSKNV